MMKTNDQTEMKSIASETEALITLAGRSLDWVDQYAGEAARQGIRNSIKASRRNLKKVLAATAKRPSVAIFGQSQVGKSYLVQNLTKPDDSPYLLIKIPGKSADANFLTEMNPDGGRESTGVVTRFTTKPADGTADYPIRVTLFNQLEVAAILVNGFWSDLKDLQKREELWDPQKVKALFADLVTDRSPKPGISEDDVHDFVQYIRTSFSDSIGIHKLEECGYFSSLVEYLPLIAPGDRGKVLGQLWYQNDFFNELFSRLTAGLQLTGHHTVLFAAENTVAPKATTILDVQRVKEILDDSTSHPVVHVMLPDGKKVGIDRSVFSALTKEVELAIANDFSSDELRQFIHQSDILDFPGSKSREKIPEVVFESNPPEQKLQLFIRGKVSYLFDTYTQNQGVSSLLYCMDNHPPEEKGAPARLANWVNHYVGANPEARRERLKNITEILSREEVHVQSISPLMVVLTKFNVEMDKVMPGQAENKEANDSKWFARLEENFGKFMTRPVEDKWVYYWAEKNAPFQFVFPMRDPLYSRAIFEGLDEHNMEATLRPERKKAIDAMGASFKASGLVRQHVPDPEAVWGELSSPNGTGLKQLCKYLAPAAHPAVTTTRLRAEVAKARNELLNSLTPHLISGDISEDLRKARKEASLVWTAIMGLSLKEHGSLSNILQSMVVTDVEIWRLLYDFKFDRDPTENTHKKEVADLGPIISEFQQLGIEIESGSGPAEVLRSLRRFYDGFSDEEIRSTVHDLLGIDLDQLVNQLDPSLERPSNGDFVQYVIQYWHAKLLDAIRDDRLFNTVNEKQQDAVVSLINEIVKGIARFELREHLDTRIRKIVEGTIEAKEFDLVASCCSSILNSFFFSSGWFFAREEEKPMHPGSGKHIFSEQGYLVTADTLSGYSSGKPNRNFLQQWSHGFRALYEENVQHKYGVKDRKAELGNAELAGIVSEMEHQSR